MSNGLSARRKKRQRRADIKKAQKILYQQVADHGQPSASVLVRLLSQQGCVFLGVKRGALGGRYLPVVKLEEIAIAGATEEPKELAEMLLKIGSGLLAALVQYDLQSEGSSIKGLAEKLAVWAKLDLDSIRAEMAEQDDDADNAAIVEDVVTAVDVEAGTVTYGPPPPGEQDRLDAEAVDIMAAAVNP